MIEGLIPVVKLPPSEYRELWRAKYVEQDGRCASCGRRGRALQLHHVHGRGLAGGFRRDTMASTELLCGDRDCHRKADENRPSKFGREGE